MNFLPLQQAELIGGLEECVAYVSVLGMLMIVLDDEQSKENDYRCRLLLRRLAIRVVQVISGPWTRFSIQVDSKVSGFCEHH